MALTATVTPGKTFVGSELVTNSKLNQLAAPTVTITGTADAAAITNNSVTALKGAYGPWFYCTDGGTANAHSLTAAASATTLPTSLVAGQEFAYTAANTNTGAVTVAISGIGGTVALTKNGSTALAAGDVRSGQLVWVRYDGTQMQLATPNGQPRLDRFAPTATSATAYTATFAPTLTALTNGTRVLVRWHATNTSTATFAPDGLTAKAITKAGDTALSAGDVVLNQISELVYDSTLDHWLLTSAAGSSAVRSTVPVRQCVLSCSGDGTTGLPNYMVASTTTAIGFQNCDTTNLVMAFAYGFDTAGAVDYVAVVNTNSSSVWTGLNGASTTYYLFADRNITTGAITYDKTTTRPIYTQVPGTGNNTYIIPQSKMVDGSSTAIQRLFLGEIATSAGSVISTITPYMPQGQYVSPETALPATAVNTTVTLTHQLGLQPVQLRWVMRCLTDNLGYVAGDEVELWSGSFSDQLSRVWFTPVSTVTSLVCVLPWTTMTILPYLWNKTTYGVPAAITPGNWRLVAYAGRGW